MIESAKIYKGKEVENVFIGKPWEIADELGCTVSINSINTIYPKVVFEKIYESDDYFNSVFDLLKSIPDCDINNLSGEHLEKAEVELFKTKLRFWVAEQIGEKYIEMGDSSYEPYVHINTNDAQVWFWYDPDTMQNRQRIEFGLKIDFEKTTQYWEETQDYEDYVSENE